ncbi:MAG: YraN family protein [Eubacteriales bacterium]|nr:YraN family protein [Eubacteriales bacterium]
MANNREVGAFFEKAAVDYLIQNGYAILETNFRYRRLGEIDIIAKDGDYNCFIEVKARSSSKFGFPSEAIGYKKQLRIKKLASIYAVAFTGENLNIRFDAILIKFKGNDIEKIITGIELVKDAF